MHDISLALGLIGFLSVGIFLGTVRLLRSTHRRVLDVAAVAIVLLTAAYVRWVWGQLWIVQWIPLPSVIVLSNWFPLLLAALGAVVWVRLETDGSTRRGSDSDEEQTGSSSDRQPLLTVRRIVSMGLVIGGAIYSVLHFIPLSVPQCGEVWDPPLDIFPWPVCRQTLPETCSAASAATILYSLGIPTTEQEMARLCLTKRGTTWLGLYHGLSTKLAGTNHRVEFFETQADDLPVLAAQHPLLLCCKLNSAAARDAPEYVTRGGWIPGIAHSVVYFGKVDGYHIIGDPSVGYEFWRDKDLEILWTGQGLQIGHLRPHNAPPDVSPEL